MSALSPSILQNLTGHRSDVSSCDFASDYTLITGSSDKTIRIWDWTTGQGYVERSNSPLRGHKYQVTCVRVSPQGAMLATASVDGTAVLWNLFSGVKLYTMVQVNGDAIRVCRFAPDSSILVTAGDNGAVCVWDLVHRSLIRSVFEHEGTTQSLSFTPDSQYLISACSLEVIRVWYVQDLVDTATESSCNPIAKLDNAHDLGVFCVDVSKIITVDENDLLRKHYTMATCGNSNEIKIWRLTSRSIPKYKTSSPNELAVRYWGSYDGHTSSVTSVRYNSAGTFLISSSLDKLVKIWDPVDGSCIATLEGHSRYVNCVAISKDSLLAVSGSNDKQVLVWDLTGECTLESDLVKGVRVSGGVGGLPELQVLRQVEEDDNEVKLIEKIDDISDGAINCCSFNDKGVLATGSGDKMVRLFRVVEENNNVEEIAWSPLEGHTYPVNYVEFSRDGTKLASCSLDGCTNIWISETGEKMVTLPENSLGIKVSRFSPDGTLLITAGDDEKATIWDLDNIEEIATLEGHLDSVTSASFTPDGQIIATTSANSDFRLWKNSDHCCILVKEDAHDCGIQGCDFSQNLEPVPTNVIDVQTYLLGTCGNDSLVKLWRISFPQCKEYQLNYEDIEIKVWRSLQGHGGNVICVRFSPNVSEIICSTATDRQSRIWSVYSAECLYVLDHDSIVTACAFSTDCSLLATGCIDKTLWLWKLPQQLVFRTMVANKIKCRSKALIDWSTSDFVKWLKDMDLETIIPNALNASLDGQKLLTFTEDQICSGLDLSDEETSKLTKEIRWLKQDELQISLMKCGEIPHEFLCPITHEIMREPVTCSDGFTYEKNAICEWFMSGKYTSPLTNEILINTQYTYNQELRNAIHSFLENED